MGSTVVDRLKVSLSVTWGLGRLFGSLACLSVFVGCISTPRTLVLDADFTLREREAISTAALEWCLATDSEEGCIVVSGTTSRGFYDSARPPAVMRLSHKHLFVRSLDQWSDFSGGLLQGFSDGRDIVLVYDRLWSLNELHSVALHEFGHHIGQFSHTATGILAPSAIGDCIDSVSLAAVCDCISCGPASAPTCR